MRDLLLLGHYVWKADGGFTAFDGCWKKMVVMSQVLELCLSHVLVKVHYFSLRGLGCATYSKFGDFFSDVLRRKVVSWADRAYILLPCLLLLDKIRWRLGVFS